jgi:hypothetical protein
MYKLWAAVFKNLKNRVTYPSIRNFIGSSKKDVSGVSNTTGRIQSPKT